MKRLKLYKFFESVESIKAELSDILIDLKDISEDWYFEIRGDEFSKLVEVYISFGDEEPQGLERSEDDEGPVWRDKDVSKDVFLTIKTVINYMENISWKAHLSIVTTFDNNPDYDLIEKVTLEELENCYISENEFIKLQFRPN